MLEHVKPPLFRYGDRVLIKNYFGTKGRIVELLGPLAPGWMQTYMVRVPGDPKPRRVPVREDQIELLPPKAPKPPAADAPPAE